MNKLVILAGILGIVAAFGLWFYSGDRSPFDMDSFAKCLRDKGVVMYGTDSCAHCQSQKLRFGSAFEFIPYVECSNDPEKCLSLGINKTPTWIFEDGKKIEGDLSLEELSEASGCELDKKLSPIGL